MRLSAHAPVVSVIVAAAAGVTGVPSVFQTVIWLWVPSDTYTRWPAGRFGRAAGVVLTVMPIGAPAVPVSSVFHLVMKVPFELSFMTRPLPLSATYTLPDESMPTSRGCSNWMLPALAPLPSEPTRQTCVPLVVYSAT